MPRTLTDPNYDGTLEFQERVEDVDGDSLSISVELDAIDDGTGYTQQNTDISNVAWLSYTKTTNTLGSGATEVLLDFTVDYSSLSKGYKYRIAMTADDGFATSTRNTVIEVTS